ncbi:MAG: winged helix-turn-helix domain-containing protein, partial [Actinomycetota bacterium]|nr:winged helix-turn-helix domain-containing protein [Actinomycetota bacterium]
AAGVLLVQGAYSEAGVDDGEVVEPLIEELALMAGWLGLDTVASTNRGALAVALQRAGVAAVVAG